QLEAEGVAFVCGCEAGIDLSVEELRHRYDAVVLATGAQQQREVDLPGRELDGIHLALPYLRDRNRAIGGRPPWHAPLSAAGRRGAGAARGAPPPRPPRRAARAGAPRPRAAPPRPP